MVTGRPEFTSRRDARAAVAHCAGPSTTARTIAFSRVPLARTRHCNAVNYNITIVYLYGPPENPGTSTRGRRRAEISRAFWATPAPRQLSPPDPYGLVGPQSLVLGLPDPVGANERNPVPKVCWSTRISVSGQTNEHICARRWSSRKVELPHAHNESARGNETAGPSYFSFTRLRTPKKKPNVPMCPNRTLLRRYSFHF